MMMRKAFLSIALAAVMVAGVFSAVPAQAVEVPAEPNIVDPVEDANTTSGNTEGPADGSTVGDLMAVWFTNTVDTFSVHIQTQAPPPASSGTVYDVYTNQTEDFSGYMNGCLRITLVIPSSSPVGGPYQGDPLIKLVDRCNDEGTSVYANGVEGEWTVEALEDGSGVQTATFPRSYSPLLDDGAVLTTPQARSSVPVGSSAETPEGPVGYVSFRIDDTVEGTDYTVTGGDGDDPVVEEPPPADDSVKKEKKLTKKDCKKIKNRKKRRRCLKKLKAQNKKKEPEVEECPAYEPGEQGAEAETVLVTDEHTEEAPLEMTIEQAEGLPEVAVAHTILNVQQDSSAAESGLYIRYEFPLPEDHDINVFYADGTRAARSADFNLVPGQGIGIVEGGHAEQTAEQIDGIRTADCAGYTVDFSNYTGMGGEYTVKFWLGEIQNDPAAPEGGARSALELMQETLR